MTENRSRAGQQRITDVNGIPGLSLLPTAVDAELASRVVSALRSQRWKRWTWTYTKFARQDFGYEYDLRSRIATPTDAIPDGLKALFPALRAAGWTGEDPNQVIVTRYPPRGITRGAHRLGHVRPDHRRHQPGGRMADLLQHPPGAGQLDPAARAVRLRHGGGGQEPLVPPNPPQLRCRKRTDLADVPHESPRRRAGSRLQERDLRSRVETPTDLIPDELAAFVTPARLIRPLSQAPITRRRRSA